MSNTISIGDKLPFTYLTTITNERVNLIKTPGLVHIQFRRFSGCPICNLHLRQFSRKLDDLTQLGVEELVIFHSTATVIQENQVQDWTKQFKFIADPTRSLYISVGADLSGWNYITSYDCKAVKALIQSLPNLIGKTKLGTEGVVTQRPMDLLVDRMTGVVLI